MPIHCRTNARCRMPGASADGGNVNFFIIQCCKRILEISIGLRHLRTKVVTKMLRACDYCKIPQRLANHDFWYYLAVLPNVCEVLLELFNTRDYLLRGRLEVNTKVPDAASCKRVYSVQPYSDFHEML